MLTLSLRRATVNHVRMFATRNYSDRGHTMGPKIQKSVSKKDYIRSELKENPEFFKAFPHLKPVVDGALAKDGQSHTGDINSRDLFTSEQVAPPKADYFESLLH